MIDAATVVWLTEGAASQVQTSPSAEARRALDAWATARSVRLVAPSEEGPPALPVDWAAGDAVERDLGLARDALAGLDFDSTERQLARAESVLRDHPELPQAAWLRAEVERAWSARWLREGDESRAQRAWQRAAALDGGRAPGLGEKAFEPGPTIDATIDLSGSGALRLDEAGIAAGAVRRGEGEHALAIVRADGAATWAGWVSLGQGAVVRVHAPEAPGCSREDVQRARWRGGEVKPVGVRCGRWIAAIVKTDGAIGVATCEAGSCSPVVEWRDASAALGRAGGSRPETEPPRAHWPAWATWTLAAVGVAGASLGIAAAAGAFKSAPTETRFVNGGLRIHSF